MMISLRATQRESSLVAVMLQKPLPVLLVSVMVLFAPLAAAQERPRQAGARTRGASAGRSSGATAIDIKKYDDVITKDAQTLAGVSPGKHSKTSLSGSRRSSPK
jgi:hypothetical protein